jgi:hypothetical protein
MQWQHLVIRCFRSNFEKNSTIWPSEHLVTRYFVKARKFSKVVLCTCCFGTKNHVIINFMIKSKFHTELILINVYLLKQKISCNFSLHFQILDVG